MALTVRHRKVTGAAANPKVLVDGPAWDDTHEVAGLEEAFALKANLAGGNAFTGGQSFIGGGGDTTESDAQVTVQNSALTATDVYDQQVPDGWFTWDGVRSVVDVPPETTATNVNAFGFYVRNRAVSDGHTANAVGVYGLATVEVDGGSSWGFNTVVTDAAVPGIITTSNRTLIGYELDFAVNGTGTSVQGISMLGTSVVQPEAATAVQIGSLSHQDRTIARWTSAFVTENGVTDTTLIVGATAESGNNVPSSAIKFAHFNGSGAGHYGILQHVTAGLQYSREDRANGLQFGTAATGSSPIFSAFGSDTNVSLTLAAKGAGSVIVASPASFSSTLALASDFAINTNKFVVGGSTGNTTIAGTLGVGAGGSFGGFLICANDFAVNTNKFIVASASGNTTVAGTLGVSGGGTFSSFLICANDFAVATNKFIVASASGNTTVAGLINCANEIRAGGDTGGAASRNTLTGTSDVTANSTGVGSIKFKGATSRDSSGFVKIYIGTTAYYVPVFSAITG